MLLNKLLNKIAVVSLVISSTTMAAQEINLPTPATTAGMPINEVISSRRSVRSFDSSRELTEEQIGQLLWMSLGVNRPTETDAKNRTQANRSNPTALNSQEISAYVFKADGVWLYQPATHSLTLVKDGDYRSMVAGTAQFKQEFVLDAPVSVVFVADVSKLAQGDNSKLIAMIDVGIACENFTLACVANGLATVPRATMDSAAISQLLNLSTQQIPAMNNPVGYAK